MALVNHVPVCVYFSLPFILRFFFFIFDPSSYSSQFTLTRLKRNKNQRRGRSIGFTWMNCAAKGRLELE